MVKSWAAGLVDEYETGFATTIDWEAAKQLNSTLHIKEEKDGWTYTLGIRHFPAGNGKPELYEVRFQKSNYPLIASDFKSVKMYRMTAYKGPEFQKFNKTTELKHGDWVYANFNTQVF